MRGRVAAAMFIGLSVACASSSRTAPPNRTKSQRTSAPSAYNSYRFQDLNNNYDVQQTSSPSFESTDSVSDLHVGDGQKIVEIHFRITPEQPNAPSPFLVRFYVLIPKADAESGGCEGASGDLTFVDTANRPFALRDYCADLAVVVTADFRKDWAAETAARDLIAASLVANSTKASSVLLGMDPVEAPASTLTKEPHLAAIALSR